MISLTISDNAGTPSVGAVATIGDSGGGPVDVYYSEADRGWLGGTWMLAGSRVGNGSVALALPQRHYWVVARSSNDCSLPVRCAVTDGLTAVAARCHEGIVAILKSLNLAEIGQRVFRQLFVDDTEGLTPCLYVYSGGGPNESEETGLNQLDYIVYPFVVAFVDVHSVTDHRPLAKYQLWRQQVSRAFRVRPDLGVPELAYASVVPGAIGVLPTQEFQKYGGIMTVNCVCREPRGVGA